MKTLEVTMVGGGMIAHDQILPSLYQLQRDGRVGGITVCDRSAAALDALAGAEGIKRAFPGQTFRAIAGDFRDVLKNLPPRNLVVAAVPDQLHYPVITAALEADQHVLTVKPLVLKAAEALRIEQEAYKRGLMVGIEYHKRFDDRSFMARKRYREGMFGEFRLGTACLLEKWYYRYSNFQNWCTVENSDAFTYIGCHYVDLVHFITGLVPVSVSLYGIRDKYPNGNEGFLWTDARVIWSNGACLNVQNALGFPDAAPGTNTQSLTMYCAGNEVGTLVYHSDQYRGLKYSYTQNPGGAGATQYAEPSPDYFQYLDLGGPGLKPAGYGYRSVEHIVLNAARVENEGADDLAARQRILRELDERGVMATPANSRYNEFVIEAGRLSVMNEGREAVIDYDAGSVKLK